MEDEYGWPVAGSERWRLPGSERWRLPESGRWRVPGQVAGGAVAGAVLAGMVIGIWHTTLHVEHSACTSQTEICLGPPLGGLIAGIAAVVITTLAGFALLGIRPLVASVPAGIIIAWLAVTCVTTAVHDVGSPSAWALIPVLAAGYALVASVVLCAGRTRIIALCLLAAFMLTGQLAAKMIGNAIQSSQQRARLEALPFHLELPAAAGYKIAHAYPGNGTLQVDMVPNSAQRDRWGVYENIVITVTIGPTDTPSGTAGCPQPTAPAGRTCQAPRPAVFVSRNPGQTIVTARYRDMIVTASAATADAPADAIEQAATTLHPATASQIQALG